MELRPAQTALLAGRTASRWATLTSITAPRPSVPLSIYSSSFSRSFSSTRARLQEAEAAVPLPGGGMAGYHRQRTQRQQEAQQQQQQQAPEETRGQPPRINSLFAPSSSSPSDYRQPWVNRPSNAQIVPPSARGSEQDIIKELMNSDPNKPHLSDMEKQLKGFYERPIDVKYRLRPVVGRTVELTTAGSVANGKSGRNIDFAKALARLDMQVKVNRVKNDVARQRFHERNGLKRKRLRTERWQRRFKDGFKATCRRVSELARQGW